MSHTPLEPHTYLYIYTPLFSGHMSDRYRYPSKYWAVYEKETKLGYFDTGWILSSEYNYKNIPSQ